MHMPENNTPDFAPPPAGTHLAICYRVIDLGTQQGDYMGQPKHQRKVLLSWELSEEPMEDGRPFTIHQRYTLSSSEKSHLRKHLESWRGKVFKPDDFGPGGFDIQNVLDVPCMLSVVHNEKNERTYANIGGVLKAPKGADIPARTNDIVYLSLDPERFSEDAWDNLPDSIKDTIRKSPEWATLPRNQSGNGNGYQAPEDGGDFNDEIPF